MPENIATSPGTGEPTSGTPSGVVSSPGAGSPTSGDDEQVKELRQRLTTQAEEIKTLGEELTGLRGSLGRYPDSERLIQFLRTGEFEEPVVRNGQGPTGEPGASAENMLAKAFEEVDGEAFTQGMRALREEITKDLSKQYDGRFKDVSQRTTDGVVRNFFADRQAPDMTQAGSEFWKHTSKLVNEGGTTGRAINSLLQTDLEAGLEFAWEQYTKTHGDPATEARKREGVEARRLASLESGAGLPSNIAPYLLEKDGPQRRNMSQIHALLKEKGVFKE